MNRFFDQWLLSLQVILLILIGSVSQVMSVETNPSKDPIERLIQGNLRYVNSETVCHNDWTAKRSALVKNQNPFAIIIACSDSRVPPEIVFDQSLGNLFVIRLAGNVVDNFAIGSIEYGVNVLGAKLVVVLGHSNCGAVNAALSGSTFDNHIQDVVKAIHPAIKTLKETSNNPLEMATKANVRNVEEKLKSSKPVIAKLSENGSLRIIGAYYDLETGKVEFLDKPSTTNKNN